MLGANDVEGDEPDEWDELDGLAEGFDATIFRKP